MMVDASGSRCPVCRARFRGAVECPRCGADLAPLMTLACQAWQARQAARRALASGDVNTAAVWISAAQRLHATARGDRLQRLIALLAWRL